MKLLAQIISFLALGVTATTPLLFFYDKLDLVETKGCLLVAAFVWFVAAPFWMEHKAS